MSKMFEWSFSWQRWFFGVGYDSYEIGTDYDLERDECMATETHRSINLFLGPIALFVNF